MLADPVPPNPLELTFSAKTDEMLNLLKERFDCIIIDSPPINIVSEIFYHAILADTSLIIVRLNKTSRDKIERTVNDLKISDIKNNILVINDIGSEGNGNDYGGKYGSAYGYGDVYDKGEES